MENFPDYLGIMNHWWEGHTHTYMYTRHGSHQGFKSKHQRSRESLEMEVMMREEEESRTIGLFLDGAMEMNQ